jgi:hypothetical protein
VAEGRVRDQRVKLTAAAEGGRDLFPQGLDSAFPKQAATCVLINKINRFHKNGPLKSWGHWTFQSARCRKQNKRQTHPGTRRAGMPAIRRVYNPPSFH